MEARHSFKRRSPASTEFLERPRSAELDRNEVEPFAPLVNKPRSESTLEAQLYAAMRLALDF